MRLRNAAGSFGLVFFVSVIGVPSTADAAGQKPLSQSLTGGAKADFDAGKLLAGDGDFAGALIKFQSSYDASNDPRLLWNIAFCQKNLRHYAKVVSLLQRYLTEGGETLPAGDKKDAQDLISTIEPFTTKMTITVSEPGAQIFVDDELVGTSPLAAPVVLDIGERHLRIEKEGFVKYERGLVVGGSAETTTAVVLEKIVHEGKIIVEAPAAATVLLDDKEVGQGKIQQVLSSGGHQLRVVAKGMRAYQTEIVIEDKETRQLTVSLEPEAPAQKPKLRVAVGCADAEPRSPGDGLVVYTDGMEVLPPGEVKSRLNMALGRNVVDFVEYPIEPGTHQLRIVSKGCGSLDQSVNVDPVAGALVSGSLPTDRPVPFQGPEGSPGVGRLGLALWMPGGYTAVDSVPEAYEGDFGSMAGIALDAGLVSRWFAAYLNAAYASGSFQRATTTTNFLLPSSTQTNWEQLTVRFGPRFPLNHVALGFGGVVGGQEVDLEKVRTGFLEVVGGAYAEIDIEPLCDFGLYAQGGIQFSSQRDQKDAFGSLQIGAFWEPNPRCRVEQSTPIGLKTENAAPKPPTTAK